MTIKDTVNLIQAVNRSIDGVVTVPNFDKYPLAVDSNRCPTVLTWPDTATWTRQQFGGKKREDRVYVIMVFVSSAGQGELPSRSTKAVDLLEAFREKWLSLDENGYPTALANMSPQVTVMWQDGYPQDTGIGVLPALKVGETSYTGFEIRLKIRYLE